MKLDRMKQAFMDALGVGATIDWENLKYRSIEAWDSVAHMALIAEIEAVFDIMLETDDVIGMSSYSKAVEIVSKYGVEIEAA